MITIVEHHHGSQITTSPKREPSVNAMTTVELVVSMPAPVDQRLHAERQERMRLLAHDAEKHGLTVTLEAPGRYIVRDPAEPGICQLVTPFSCTCSRYGIFRRCEHVALVRMAEGII